jgi:hypothetical protein
VRRNWLRPLPRPIIIPGVVTLVTLGDVRSLIERNLTTRCRQRAAWSYVARRLAEAARDGGDTKRVAVPLRMVLLVEGVECRPQAMLRSFPFSALRY